MSRVANFSSSSIYHLISKSHGSWSLENVGKPFYTYIKEKVREHRTGVAISKETSPRSVAWGRFMEQYTFENKLGIKYQLVSKDRYYHPELPWSGMPDTILNDSIGDIKNPWTVNSFCDSVDAINESVKKFKENVPNYYWQLVSNAILCKKEYAEIFIHIPYKDELEAVREATELYDGDQNKIAFINWATDDELPHIIRGRYYKDLNHLRFIVPEEDKEILTKRVKMAAKILNKEINN